MKILLLAYACQPEHGSEPKNGWQWASRLSEKHEVHLLTHPRGKQAITERLKSLPANRLEVHYVELPGFLDPWTRINAEKLVRLRYVFWQVAAYIKAKNLAQTITYDLVHHVTWASLAGLTLGWALGRPFVWGPVGGGQTAPMRMRKYLGRKGAIREWVRNLRVAAIPWNLPARMAARNCAIALTSNLETQQLAEQLGARQVRLLLDTAVDPTWAPDVMPERKPKKTPVVLWTGRLEPHKALNLALESFARIGSDQEAELWVLGDGPLRGECEQYAAQLGIARRVKFLGWIPYEQMGKLMRDADVFLFTSLRDSCPQPVLEALAWGLPAVSLNHQGIRLMPDSAVSKVAVTTPQEVVARLADSLRELLQSPEMRWQMGRAGQKWVQEHHLWSRRVEMVAAEVYAPCSGHLEEIEKAAGVR